ncbi:PLDc_N domain-containing protein [Candidatus Woesearchaeota archaeon]|nr:PLDc_N domain-containing protein [Candidatus Woesearchaeota archaeon]
MKKISKLMALVLIAFSAVGAANAFGYFRNPDMYDFIGMPGFGMVMGLGAAAVLIGILLFVFWLWMLADCLKRDFKKDVEKIVWILVLIFLHLLGAIIYYFVVKIPNKKAGKKGK